MHGHHKHDPLDVPLVSIPRHAATRTADWNKLIARNIMAALHTPPNMNSLLTQAALYRAQDKVRPTSMVELVCRESSCACSVPTSARSCCTTERSFSCSFRTNSSSASAYEAFFKASRSRCSMFRVASRPSVPRELLPGLCNPSEAKAWICGEVGDCVPTPVLLV